MIAKTDSPRVSVHITRYSRAGLLGKTDSGARAIIRRREVAWEGPKSLQQYVNQSREAFVLGYDPIREQFELSLRLVERDPWKGIELRYPTDAEVEGKVVGLIQEAAFVELEPGVDAYLPLSDFPQSPAKRPEESLWLHDLIKGVIVEVLPSHRRLRISVSALVSRRERAARRQLWVDDAHVDRSGVTIAEVLPNAIRHHLLHIGVAESASCPARRLRVLLVEDDEVFAAGMSSLLRSNHCDVVVERDGAAARDLFPQGSAPFDVIIVDWNLPTLKGHVLLKRLREHDTSCRCVMVLDPTHLRGNPEVAEFVNTEEVDVLAKSAGESLGVALLAILRDVREGAAAPGARSYPRATESRDTTSDLGFLNLRTETSDLSRGHKAQLGAVLGQLRLDTAALWAGVVRLDPGHFLPVVEAFDGPLLAINNAPPDIMYGPLRDVLKDSESIWTETSTKTQGFERLLELCAFRGFIGVPLPVTESGGYGLVLLKAKQPFTSHEFKESQVGALLLAQIIREKRLIETLRPWQAQNLVGQITDSIVHEVNNKLSGIELLVTSLQEGIRELARWPEKADDATFLRELEDDIQGVDKAQKAASRLRDWYLGITATDEPQGIHLRKLAGEMLRAIRSQAQELNVVLSLKCPRQLPQVSARPSQLQQIFLNLILNAIQQVAETRRIGRLAIEISDAGQVPLPILVRFIDQGPGIHRQLWDRVFDFGFTTKPRGAGLGLTIARSAAAELGGRLSVEASHMQLGTTFLLELPKGGSIESGDLCSLGG